MADDVIDGYEIGLANIPVAYVAHAAQRFLAGEVPGQHTAFAPSPAQLASEARRHWHMALDGERRRRHPLPPPEIDRSPEARERVRRLTAEITARLGPDTGPSAAARQRRDLFTRTNARFAPDASEASIARRLGMGE